MRVPRLHLIPRLALLAIIATAAAVTFIVWSRRHMQAGSQEKVHGGSSSRAGECLTLNARCNVYNGDFCCGKLYCHELPSMGATCVSPGGSEYYQELLADGWLEEEDSKR
ncbi:hypothetical protein HO173_003599 [Letharia columbiana]|uniref:Uncharacterized protein n=1 Tax=Letharia columbiana TaxID=112416 RepID=A0A8H6G0S3_9LECA|nr:uncharacterized protein HO173_003599 [Letharia columbiana]KAF6238319.1 hypothetical protein HO173_003599 [Letharia columbiana]